jgi:hypothetical protein
LVERVIGANQVLIGSDLIDGLPNLIDSTNSLRGSSSVRLDQDSEYAIQFQTSLACQERLASRSCFSFSTAFFFEM